MELDHIIPESLGGGTEEENLWLRLYFTSRQPEASAVSAVWPL